MFRWLKKRAAVRFMEDDTRRTIQAIASLPREKQHLIASDLFREISFAENSISRVARGAPEYINTATKMIVMRAKNRRHVALASGATSWDDPDWAASALFESWALSLSGVLGKSAQPAMQRPIQQYVEATLTAAEMEEIRINMAKDDPRAHGLKTVGE